MMRLFGDEFLIDPITDTGTCTELSPIQNGVHWCDDDQNDKSVCSLLCQTGNNPFLSEKNFYRPGAQRQSVIFPSVCVETYQSDKIDLKLV